MPILNILSLFLLWADAPSVYTGEVNLPFDLFSRGGSSIARGKHTLEIRMQGDQCTLVFAGPEKQTVSIDGAPFTGLASFVVPVGGTILFWPEKEPTADEARSKLSPYLANVDWRATLRLYRSSNPENEELRAVLHHGAKRIQFVLLSAKPAKAEGTP